MKKSLPLLSVMAAAFLWGCISIFVTPLLSAGFSRMQIVFIRAIGAIVPLAIYMLIVDKHLFYVKLKHVPIFIGSGVVSFSFFSFCYMHAMVDCSVGVAAVLLYTAPAFVMLMSAVIFKEKITAQKCVSIALTILGCAMVSGLVGGTGRMSAMGIVFGVLSGVGYALYSIFARFGLDKYNTITVIFYTFVFSAVSSLPSFVGMGDITLNGSTLVYLCTAGLASAALPYLFYTYGLTKMENSKASIIATFEPVVAAVVGFLAFDEPMRPIKVLGIAIVFFAVVLSNIGNTH